MRQLRNILGSQTMNSKALVQIDRRQIRRPAKERSRGWWIWLPLLCLGFAGACDAVPPNSQKEERAVNEPPKEREGGGQESDNVAMATLGNGCFWCTEAVYEQLEGVLSVTSGYAGGLVVNPSYRQVCTGATGHAEVCQIRYDPERISYAELLEVFFKTHDPTTLNRQGNDVGTQYRSVIFYHDQEQKELAEAIKRDLDASGAYSDPIVTEIAPYTNFYPAEEYHQDYYRNHPEQAYCSAVIAPKLDKFRKVFADRLKKPSP